MKHSALVPMILVAGMTILSLAGCRAKTKEVSSPKTSAAKSESEEILSSVVGMLASNAQVDSYESAIMRLNRFVAREPDAVASLDSKLKETIAVLFGPASAEDVESKEFARTDMEAMRTAFFTRGIAKRIAGSDTDPLILAANVLRWIDRNLPLVSTGSHPREFPVDICVRGFADFQERAWLFVEILRQLDIPVGVVAAKNGDQLIPWLCGIWIDEEIYLFDPLVGTAVPQSPGSTQPATLREVQANPSAFTSAFADGFIPASTKELAIMLVLEPSMLSPRMALLQQSLAGDARVNLTVDYNKLVEQADRAISVIPNHLGVQAWRYPIDASAAAWTRRNENRIEFHWLSPDFTARTDQLAGKFDSAIKIFVEQDLRPVSPVVYDLMMVEWKVPESIRQSVLARQRCGQLYFTAVAQVEQHGMESPAASEWSARAVAQMETPAVLEGDILEQPEFGRAFISADGIPRDGEGKKIWEMLPVNIQDLLRMAATSKEKAAIVGRMVSEAAPQVSIPRPLTVEQLKQVLAAINEILMTKAPFSDDELQEAMKDRQAMLAADSAYAREHPSARIWRNRVALDRWAGKSILPLDRRWLASAILLQAEIERTGGQVDQARQRLLAAYPALEPVQGAMLRARAARIP